MTKTTTQEDPLAVGVDGALDRSVASFTNLIKDLGLDIRVLPTTGGERAFLMGGQVGYLKDLALHLLNENANLGNSGFPDELLLTMYRMGSGTHAAGLADRVASKLKSARRVSA